jgi:hypothetical protein
MALHAFGWCGESKSTDEVSIWWHFWPSPCDSSERWYATRTVLRCGWYWTGYFRSDFARWHHERVQALRKFKGPYRVGTTGEFDCRCMYILARAAQPRAVIETGVLYGAISGHILAALAQNRTGTLYSIELGRVVTRATP